jgi:hypothetical protein
MAWGLLIGLSLIIISSSQELDDDDEDFSDPITTPEIIPLITPIPQITAKTGKADKIESTPVLLVLAISAAIYYATS